MRLEIFRPVLLLLLGTLSACGSSHTGEGSLNDAKFGPATLLYSPNGEPLNGGPYGRPTCQEAKNLWFDRMDVARQGYLTLPQFLADATAQFERMDIDHNGYLVSEELERFRTPYRQETASLATSDDTPVDANGNRRRSRNPSNGPRGTDPSYFGAQPDPVMSADLNNDFKVTKEEFRTQAQNIFVAMDKDHTGRMTRDEVLQTCKRIEK